MPALVAGIHVLIASAVEAWMAGTSPAMTEELYACHLGRCDASRSTITQTCPQWHHPRVSIGRDVPLLHHAPPARELDGKEAAEFRA